MRVSVVLATYNGGKYIEELLESLLTQTYCDYQIYIHDDGSEDNTVAICEYYRNRYPNIIFLLNGEPTGGSKNNFFYLLKNIQSDYIFFCDQDDIWDPKKIESMIKVAEQKHEKGKGMLIYSDLKVVDDSLNVLYESYYKLTHVLPCYIDYKNVLVKGYVPGCAMMINNHLKEDMLCYDDLSTIKMHDWWAMIVAFQTNAKILFLDQPFVLYRQHANNVIGVKNLSARDRVIFNLKRVLNGSIAKEKKWNLESPRIQATQVKYIKFTNEDAQKFALAFAALSDKNKIHRMAFYLRHFRHTYRLWWMVLWA